MSHVKTEFTKSKASDEESVSELERQIGVFFIEEFAENLNKEAKEEAEEIIWHISICRWAD